MGFNHFWMFLTFQYRGLHHLDMYCTLIIEVWLKSNIHFECRYLELWNTCIITLFFIVSNVRDGTESKYPSIVFLSILLSFTCSPQNVHSVLASSLVFNLSASCHPSVWQRVQQSSNHKQIMILCVDFTCWRKNLVYTKLSWLHYRIHMELKHFDHVLL